MALECPRKLNYARDLRYFDARANDDFLSSLAQGGHQVGELARRMFPEGILVADPSPADQVLNTESLLGRPEVTILEGTIQYGNLLVRCDVLRKNGNRLELIEVKAKGFDWRKDRFLSARKAVHPILSGWRPYLYDVAYQAYVLRLAYPQLHIEPFLLLLDKTISVPFSGLNTLLPVTAAGRQISINVDPTFDIERLNSPILRQVDVGREVALLLEHPIDVTGRQQSFEEFITEISDGLRLGNSLPAAIGNQCKRCQYYAEKSDVTANTRSGWNECMTESARIGSHGISRSETVFSLHKITPARLDKLLQAGPVELAKIAGPALGDDVEPLDAITADQRRRMQWLEARGELEEPFMLNGPLQAALDEWRWPLNFIDFETTRPALPYHAKRTPYAQIAFQFSHHVLQRDGRLTHQTQFLQATPGTPPTLPMLRALLAALSANNGTVVHWWTHEDTVLKEVREQILVDKPGDGPDLSRFIESMVGSAETPGRLADLGKLVSNTVYYPGTGGSSSIKRVLPIALARSPLLRQRYGAPIYGTAEIPSLNFSEWRWVVEDNQGAVLNPYSLLDPLFANADVQAAVSQAEDDDSGSEGDFVANGGAAIIAYDTLQQSKLPALERKRLVAQLLRYCELDTLAMVMVYQSLVERRDPKSDLST